MAILIDENTKVLIQGITGREGSVRAVFMKGYGTKIVAGVTPGRGGTNVAEIPVYDTVEEAIKKHGTIDASVTFVPGPMVKDAVLEAIDAGIKFIVMPVERVPLRDILEMVVEAKRAGTKLLGPGSLGILSTGKAAMGWLGGTAEMARSIFVPGPIGVISRSGGQTSTLVWAIKEAGLGVTTALHIGTEPVVGLTIADVLELFEKDDETKAVALFGEMGGVQEEEAAELIKMGKYTKPLVAYIAGAWAPEGMRFSHASSIIERGRGTAQDKIARLKEAGVHIVDRPDEIAPLIKRLIGG